MKSSLILLLMFSMATATAQTLGIDSKTPKQVVEELWKLETSGERLTSEGWNDANRFFVRASRPPVHKVIRVINAWSVWDPLAVRNENLPEDTCEIEVGVLAIWGIDSDMRFFVASKTMKSGIPFKLVHTSLRWKLGPDGATMMPVTETPEWRIGPPDNSGWDNTIWLAKDAAIHYVEGVRDSTTNPEVRQNCVATLRKLRSIHEYPPQ